MANKLALVIGISAYGNRWATLKNCVADAEDIAETLAFQEYGFTVDKLIDERATKPDIFRWIIEAKRSGADQILFYFAGHGVVDELGSFLVTYDNKDFDEGIALSTSCASSSRKRVREQRSL